MAIQPPNAPDVLWKYRDWGDFARRMIVDGEIHFSTLEQLNDPFEFRWQDQYPATHQELDRFVRAVLQKKFPLDSVQQRRIRYAQALSEVRQLAANGRGRSPTVTRLFHGVFSVSEINDDVLMWSHYANHHRGICVGVRPKVINKLFLPVGYVDDVPVLNVWHYVGDENSRDNFVYLSLAKAKRWEYEVEWRSISHKGVQHFLGCVGAVVLGCKISKNDRDEVLEAIERASEPITVYEAQLSNTKYTLNIRPLVTAMRNDDGTENRISKRR